MWERLWVVIAIMVGCGPAAIPEHLDGALRLSPFAGSVSGLEQGLTELSAFGYYEGLTTYGLRPSVAYAAEAGELRLLVKDSRISGSHFWEPDGWTLIVISTDCWNDVNCGWFALTHEIAESIFNPVGVEKPDGEIADACDNVTHVSSAVILGVERPIASYQISNGTCWPQ
jgi:hypothetical protein